PLRRVHRDDARALGRSRRAHRGRARSRPPRVLGPPGGLEERSLTVGLFPADFSRFQRRDRDVTAVVRSSTESPMRYLALGFLALAACTFPQYGQYGAPARGPGGGNNVAEPSNFGASNAPSNGPGHAGSPAPSAPIPTTVEFHSDCSKTTPIF